MDKKLIYQLYPAAWPGGLAAMTKHLARVKKLGADFVWLSPFFKSPWLDGGYDIADYMAIDERFGTMLDFECFMAEAKRLGLGVLLDLVMNHTSTEHEWFKRSVAGEERYKDYYCWSDSDLGWNNIFNGLTAFKFHPERQQHYLHLFHEQQADLNWQNPHVIEEFEHIIDFWVEKGVAGFRLDVVQFLDKKFTRTFVPKRFGPAAGILHYYMRKGTIEILHRLFDGRGLFTIAEAGVPLKSIAAKLAGPDGPLSATFNVLVLESVDKRLGYIKATPSFDRLQRNLRKWSELPYYVATIESHDAPRMTSRTGLSGVLLNRMMFDCDPHYACIYQGQELGLRNPELSDNISDYSDAMMIMQYEKMLQKGVAPHEAMRLLKAGARENARVPLDLIEYQLQESDGYSCLNETKRAICAWKSRQ